MYCKYCGKQQNEGMFCQYCGKKQFDEMPVKEAAPVITDIFDEEEQEIPFGDSPAQERQSAYADEYPDFPETDYPEDEYQYGDGYQYEAQAEQPAAKKSSKPIIVAAMVGVCVFFIGAAVCAALIFGGKKVKTDEPQLTEPPQTETSAAETSAPTESAEQETTEPEPEPEPEPEVDHTGWEQAYLDKAYEIWQPLYDSNADLCFCLYDINGDGFEELYIQMSDAGASTAKVLCTYADGELKVFYDNEFGYVCFPKDMDGVVFCSYGNGIEKTYYQMKENRLVEVSGVSGEDASCYDVGRNTSDFEEFAGFLGLDTPSGTGDIKSAAVIPASTLCRMTKGQLLEKIGGNYRVSWNEYKNKYTDSYVVGITSDKYFPGVVLVVNPYDINSPEEVMDNFREYPDEQTFFSVSVFDGGLIGDNAFVGMRYSEILVLIDCLGGVYNDGRTNICVVDDMYMLLYFDTPSDVSRIKDKITSIYGSGDSYGVIDAREIDPVCTGAITARITGGGAMSEAEATGKAALCVAPYDGASILWYLEKGEKVSFFGTRLEGDWMEVFYTTSAGVEKRGYIKTSQLKMLTKW